MSKEKKQKADNIFSPVLDINIPSPSELRKQRLAAERTKIEQVFAGRIVSLYDIGSNELISFDIRELRAVFAFDVDVDHHPFPILDFDSERRRVCKEEVLKYIDDHFDQIAKFTTDPVHGLTVATLAIGVVKIEDEPKNIKANEPKHDIP